MPGPLKRFLVFIVVTALGVAATNIVAGSNDQLYGVGSLCTFLSFAGGFASAAFFPFSKPEDSNEKNS